LKMHTFFFLSPTLNSACFPTSHKCNWLWLYTFVSLCIYSVTSLVIMPMLKGVCVLYVSY
jgi:hypothetical protein